MRPCEAVQSQRAATCKGGTHQAEYYFQRYARLRMHAPFLYALTTGGCKGRATGPLPSPLTIERFFNVRFLTSFQSYFGIHYLFKQSRAGFREGPMGHRAPGLPPKGGLPPNPSIFISPQASHQLNPALKQSNNHIRQFMLLLSICQFRICLLIDYLGYVAFATVRRLTYYNVYVSMLRETGTHSGLPFKLFELGVRTPEGLFLGVRYVMGIDFRRFRTFNLPMFGIILGLLATTN